MTRRFMMIAGLVVLAVSVAIGQAATKQGAATKNPPTPKNVLCGNQIIIKAGGSSATLPPTIGCEPDNRLHWVVWNFDGKEHTVKVVFLKNRSCEGSRSFPTTKADTFEVKVGLGDVELLPAKPGSKLEQSFLLLTACPTKPNLPDPKDLYAGNFVYQVYVDNVLQKRVDPELQVTVPPIIVPPVPPVKK